MTDAASLPDIARISAERFGPHVALARARQAGGGGGLTFAETWSAVRAGGEALRGAGLRDGERVLLVARQQPSWIAALLAVLEARLVAVPLPADIDPARAAAIAAFSDARAVVTDVDTDFGSLPRITLGSMSGPAGASTERRRPARDDPALLVFTSGSTSNPRAVELTHGNVLANIEALRAIRDAGPGDAFLSMLPATHLFELVGGTLGPLACGARVVYPGTMLPNRIVDALRDERITHAMAVPALLTALYHEVRDSLVASGEAHSPPLGATPSDLARWLETAPSEEIVRMHDAVRHRIGPTLRDITVGGAALDPSFAKVLDAVGVRLEVGYGLTEASPVVTLGIAGECPRGSVGRPLPGVEVTLGFGGEILVQGAGVMRGYFKDPERTREALQGGVLHTGDVGRIDARGFVYVDGRIKEAMVGATGETVFPDEMEPFYVSALFAERCVVPRPGDDGNDLATLVVWPADPAAADEAIEREVARLRAAAPGRMRVSGWVRGGDPPPRTATGKIRRRMLGESLARREAMERDELIGRLRTLAGEVTRRDASKAGPDDDLAGALGLDSLESLRLLALVEKRFDVRFDDSRLHEIRTLRQLAATVESGRKP